MEHHQSCTKGIKNISGVSCHVSSAIQLLYHAISISTKRNLILLSTELDKEHIPNIHCNHQTFLVEFGHLLRDIGIHDAGESNGLDMWSSSVNPSEFYKLLMPNIDIYHVGDAGNSFRVILSMTKKALEMLVKVPHEDNQGDGISQIAKAIFDDLQRLFWKGEISHQIIGSKLSRDDVCCGESHTTVRMKIKRRKEKKIRPLASPLPIPLKRNMTIRSSLESVLFGNTEISEYNWDILDSTEYDETKEVVESCLGSAKTEKEKNLLGLDNCDASDESSLDNDSSHDTSSSSSSTTCSSDDESSSSSSSSSSSLSSTSSSYSLSSSCWKTFKQVKVHSLPEVLILQLPRSEYVDGHKQLSSIAMEVSYELELNIPDQCLYHLDGAIVYQDDQESRHELEPLNHGHYVCYFKEKGMGSNEKDLWKKVDDDKVTIFIVDNGIIPYQDKKIVSRKALCRLFGGKTRNNKYFATLFMYKLVHKDEK